MIVLVIYLVGWICATVYGIYGQYLEDDEGVPIGWIIAMILLGGASWVSLLSMFITFCFTEMKITAWTNKKIRFGKKNKDKHT